VAVHHGAGEANQPSRRCSNEPIRPTRPTRGVNRPDRGANTSSEPRDTALTGADTHPRIRRLATLTDSSASANTQVADLPQAWKHGSLQQTLSREANHCAFRRLVSNEGISREHRARIRSAAGSGSGVWLRDIPLATRKFLGSKELQVNVRQLLGLPIPGLRTTERCSSCHRKHGRNGVQRFQHCPTSTGLWQRRHDEICGELARWLTSWNFLDVEQEPQIYFANYHLRPDIVATHPKTFQRYAIDVTVISPLQDKYLRRSSAVNGCAAKLAENYKVAHYREAMQVERPDDKFIAIAMETFGRSGHMTGEFLRESCTCCMGGRN